MTRAVALLLVGAGVAPAVAVEIGGSPLVFGLLLTWLVLGVRSGHS